MSNAMRLVGLTRMARKHEAHSSTGDLQAALQR